MQYNLVMNIAYDILSFQFVLTTRNHTNISKYDESDLKSVS